MSDQIRPESPESILSTAVQGFSALVSGPQPWPNARGFAAPNDVSVDIQAAMSARLSSLVSDYQLGNPEVALAPRGYVRSVDGTVVQVIGDTTTLPDLDTIVHLTCTSSVVARMASHVTAEILFALKTGGVR